MTSWLKWRLIGMFGVSALLSGGYWLQAQGQLPPAPPAKTPEEAGEMFFQFLAEGAEDNSYYDFDEDAAASYRGAISVPQLAALKQKSFAAQKAFFAALARQAKAPQFTSRITGREGGHTTVEVLPAPTSKGREVVVIPEDGGYRVDVKATFANWNNLSDLRLDEEWFRYTGEASPELRATDFFSRSQCISNLKQVMLAVRQYTQDYDDKYPRARNWQNNLAPYTKSRTIYTCPSIPSGRSNGYSYNQWLSQLPEAKISNESVTASFYETSNLAPNVFGPATGRAYRHESGSILAFADGHVKYLKRADEPYQYLTFNPRVAPLPMPRPPAP